MDLEITIDNLQPLVDALGDVGGNAQPMVDAAVARSAVKTQANVREEAPHRTGNLQRSVMVEDMGSSASVSANEKYAIYVEKGTAPHTITPTNKKALFWKGALHPVKLVKHPGTKANPFFTRGVEKSAEYIREQFQAVADKIVETLGGV